MTTATDRPGRGRQTRRGWIAKHMNELGLIVLIALLYLVFSNTATGFLSIYNQQNILRDAASLGIAAFGATLIIVAGEIDVSVGPMVAFLSVALSFLLGWHVPTVIALPAAMIFGIALGSIAGVLRGVFDVPSFVATLGLWSALRGLALFFTDALPVSYPPNGFLDSLDSRLAGLPVAAWIMLALFVVFSFVARKTTYGRSVYAIGGNASAAHLAGIPVTRIRIMLFATAGLLASISGILLTSRLGSGNAGAASGARVRRHRGRRRRWHGAFGRQGHHAGDAARSARDHPDRQRAGPARDQSVLSAGGARRHHRRGRAAQHHREPARGRGGVRKANDHARKNAGRVSAGKLDRRFA